MKQKEAKSSKASHRVVMILLLLIVLAIALILALVLNLKKESLSSIEDNSLNGNDQINNQNLEQKTYLNLQEVQENCLTFCEERDTQSFCYEFQILESGESSNLNIAMTCESLGNSPEFEALGIECNVIQCSQGLDQSCQGVGGKWVNPFIEGECPEEGGIAKNQLEVTDLPPIQGQICCG